MFLYISSTELGQWADKIESRGLLPLLTRSLLTNGIGQFIELDIPTKESIEKKTGFDGKVKLTAHSILGRPGKYVIEFGQSRNIREKIKNDFKKRTEQLHGKKSDCAFVFITCRSVDKKKEYADSLRSEIDKKGLWPDAKIFDADDIETWLSSDLGTTIWLAEKMGKPTCGIKSSERIWEEWGASTIVKLDEDIILARKNKDGIVERLKSWLSSGNDYFQIKSASRYESLLFFIAYLRSQHADEWEQKIIVVYDSRQWPFLIENNEYKKFILIPMFGVPENLSKCTKDGYKIFIPLSYDELISTEEHTEVISYIDKISLEQVLYQKAPEISDWILKKLNTSISLLHLRRILASGSLPPPKWIEVSTNQRESDFLLFSAFIGTWDENNEEDEKSISKIFGLRADGVSKILFNYTKMDEAPICKKLGIWKVLLPENIIEYLGDCISKDVFNGYLKVAGEVLLECENQWIIKGIARGFALISGNAHAFGEELCVRFSIGEKIKEIFQREENWTKLNNYLPFFAQAAPDTFLDLLEDMLNTRQSVVLDILRQTSKISSFVTIGIISALKSLSWYDSDFFRQIIDIFVELVAVVAPASDNPRIFDSALQTLTNIFAPWTECTTVSIARRKSVLANLTKEEKNVHIVFLLLKKLLETTRYSSALNIPEVTSYKELTNSTTSKCWTNEIIEYYQFIKKSAELIKKNNPNVNILLFPADRSVSYRTEISSLQSIVNKIHMNQEISTEELLESLEKHKEINDYCVVIIIKELRTRKLDKKRLYKLELKYINWFNDSKEHEFIMQSEIIRRFREDPQLFEELSKCRTEESRLIAKFLQNLEISPFETKEQLKKWSLFVFDSLDALKVYDVQVYERGCRILGNVLRIVLPRITGCQYEVIEECLGKIKNVEATMGEAIISERCCDINELAKEIEWCEKTIKNIRDKFPKVTSVLRKSISDLEYRVMELSKIPLVVS